MKVVMFRKRFRIELKFLGGGVLGKLKNIFLKMKKNVGTENNFLVGRSSIMMNTFANTTNS
jgi:hypothetical protein